MVQTYQQIVQVISKPPDQRSSTEIDAIIPWLRKRSNVLDNMTKNVLVEIVKYCDYQRSSRDDIIIRQGDVGDNFYIILHGTSSVYIDPNISGEDGAISFSRSPLKQPESADPTPSPTKESKPTEPMEASEPDNKSEAKQPSALTEDSSKEGPHQAKSAGSRASSRSRSRHGTKLSLTRKTSRITATPPKKRRPLDRARFGKFIIKFEAGKDFGEIALISEDSIRNASIIADEDTHFLAIGRELFNKSLRAYQEREYAAIRSFVRDHPFFSRMAPRLKRLTEMSLRKKSYIFDSTIIKQGDPVIGLYFIVRGQAQLVVEPSRHRYQYSNLWPFEAGVDIYCQEFDWLREPRKKAILRSYRDPAVLPTKSDHVIVRRTEGYAAMEKRIKNQSIQLCGIQSLDVVGDVEIICGLNSYMQSLVCTTNTDVYVLDMKNFDRLVGKRNPTILEMMKTYVESKLRTRMEQKQGHQIPLLKFLHIKLTASSLPTTKKLPPLKTTKNLPDQQFQNDHLIQCYLEGKAPLVNPHVPGALYYRELMHEKARIRENIKQRNAFNERRYLKTKNTMRGKRKPRSIMEIREALKQMMDTEVVAMNEHAARWKEEAVQAEKAIAVCEDKVKGETDRSDKEEKKSKKERESKENKAQLMDPTVTSKPTTKNETENKNESQAVESTTVTAPTKIGLKERLLALKTNKPAAPQTKPSEITSKDTVTSFSSKEKGNSVSNEHVKISVDGSVESEKTGQSKAPNIENKEQDTSVSNEVKDNDSTEIPKDSKRMSALPAISESTEEDQSRREPGKRKMNTFVAENQLRGAYLLPIIEESPPEETSQAEEQKEVNHIPPVENPSATEEEEKGNALLKKLFGFGQPKTEEASEHKTLSPTSKWNIPKRFVEERINKRLKEHKIFENPGYDDYDTNENNLNLLENRIKNFHVKYGGKAKGNIKLPKLKRFKVNMEEYNVPKPGGKVLLHKKMCKFAGARYQSHAHEHVKYQMVYKIEGFDQMKKTRTIVDTFTGFLTKKAQRAEASAAVLGQL